MVVFLNVLFLLVLFFAVSVGDVVASGLGLPFPYIMSLVGSLLGLFFGFWVNKRFLQRLRRKFPSLETFKPIFVLPFQGGQEARSWREFAISEYFWLRRLEIIPEFWELCFCFSYQSIFFITYIY